MKTTASNRGEPAGEPLRAFILEDNPRDAKLMVAMLEREGYAVQYEITDSQELFRERLENGECDIVLADFNLRSWNAFDALDILSQSGKDVPLIVVTGSLGDEGAVDCVKRGAADFVLKDRPARLPLATRQALADKRLRDERKRAEEKLRDNEAKFRLLFAANPLPMWVYDIETLRFLEVNDAAVAYYGYTRDEFLNMRTTDIRPAGYVDFDSEKLAQEKPTLDRSGPWRHQLKGGQIIRVEITTHTTEWAGRSAMLVVAQDITERLRSEEALRESEERYRLLFERNLAGVFRMTLYGRVLHCNQAMAQMLGYTLPQEVLAHRLQDFYFSEEDLSRFVNELVTMGWVTNFEMQMRRHDGTPLWVIANVSTKMEAPGDLRVMEGTLVDITVRKLVEERLREYEKAVEGLEEMLAVVDREYRYVLANKAFLNCHGREREQIAGLAVRELMGAELFENVIKKRLDECFEGKVVRYELKFNYPKVGLRDLSASLFPIEGPNGVDRVAVIVHDITDRKQAEEALRHEKHLLHTVMDNIPDLIYFKDLASHFTRINVALAQEFGLNGPAEAVGKSDRDFFSAEQAEGFSKDEQEIIGTGKPVVDKEEKLIWPSGQLTWMSTTKMPVRDAGGNIIGTFGISRDTTARKRAEERLREYEKAIEGLEEMVAVVDRDYRYVLANRAFLKPRGMQREHLMGRPVIEMLGADTFHNTVKKKLDECFEGRIVKYEMKFTYPELGERDLSISYFPIERRSGVDRVACVLQDITDRKRAEEALRESEEKYRSIVLNIPEVVWTIDSQGRPVFVTPNIEKLLGFTAEEGCQRGLAHFYETLHPDDVPAVKETLEASFRDPQPREVEFRIQRKDSRWIWIRARTTSAFEKDGVEYLQGLLSDITEQKLAEAALRDSETRYRTIFEAAGDAILLSKNETIVDCSARALDLFRCTRVQLIGQTVFTFSPAYQPGGSSSKQPALETLQRAMAEKTLNFPWQFQRQDGTRFDAEIRLTRLDVAGEAYLLGVVRDVTEYRMAEEALVRLRHAVNASGEVVFMTEPEGVFTFVNPEFTRLYGYTEAEVLGKATPRILKSGFIDAAHYARFWDALLNKRVARGEITNKTKDGQMVVVASSVSPVLNDRGEIAGYLAIQRDVTERKRLERQYLQAQKMEAVGRLAAGVAHDFNNLLTIINGYSDLLLERLPADDTAREPVVEIKDAGERATGLTRQLLAFSRQEIRTAMVLDLNVLVADSLKMLRRLIGEDVELVFAATPDLGMIKADPGQIEQVLMNLAVNSRDAMPQGGKLTIETSNFLADQDYATSHYPMPPGSYVMLAVSDTGEGMDAETQARIFEPFFTTKGQGKGTGLGLATVYGIVKQSGGFAWVYSELGKGTAFKIYLPLAEGTPEAILAAGGVAGGSETVLLVEDEAKLRALTRSILESRGYKVLEAHTSMEALLIPGQHKGPIHLLLTDVVMPLMNGREVAEKLAKLHPQMKILFMSGYTDDTVVRHGVLESGMAFLQKPFSPDTLARKVREVLDAQESSG